VFGLESLAADPLFVRLAGGVVPSIDTVYRDLCRFDDEALAAMESVLVQHGLAPLRKLRSSTVHLDIDTTVECLFGTQEGALPGPNPRYHGRPSYHPILATIAETSTCVGAQLRPGDSALGNADAATIARFARRVRGALKAHQELIARIDAGGDCGEILAALDDEDAFFVAKAKFNEELTTALTLHETWRTVDWDANGRPLKQVAEVVFQRDSWAKRGKRFRVVAVRSRGRDVGKQIHLWTHLDYTVQAYITNHPVLDAEDVAADYDGRAEVEPMIDEFKAGWGIGKIPSQDFRANHAALLIKLLAHNLMRRYVARTAPPLSYWRIEWLRRALICVPGRLLRSGRQWTLRLPPNTIGASLLN
jgi:hypothetical protein